MNPEKKKTLQEFYDTLKNTLTFDDFTKAFKVATDFILKSEVKLTEKLDAKTSEATAQIREQMEALKALEREVRASTDSTFAALKTRSMESINALFTKMRLNDRFDSMMEEMTADHRGKMAAMDSQIAAVPTKEEFLALIPEHTKETAEETRDKLENAFIQAPEEEKIDSRVIKGLADLEKRLTDRINAIPRGMAPRSNNSPMFTDLSSLTDGSTKTFTVPKNLGGIVIGSDFPTVLMEGNGFSVNAPRNQITITATNAPSQGSQLVFIGKSLFNS